MPVICCLGRSAWENSCSGLRESCPEAGSKTTCKAFDRSDAQPAADVVASDGLLAQALDVHSITGLGLLFMDLFLCEHCWRGAFPLMSLFEALYLQLSLPLLACPSSPPPCSTIPTTTSRSLKETSEGSSVRCAMIEKRYSLSHWTKGREAQCRRDDAGSEFLPDET